MIAACRDLTSVAYDYRLSERGNLVERVGTVVLCPRSVRLRAKSLPTGTLAALVIQ